MIMWTKIECYIKTEDEDLIDSVETELQENLHFIVGDENHIIRIYPCDKSECKELDKIKIEENK